ncbi:hypothetical protein ACIBJI_36845 [Nocardia sp. NPDC050408]|uniref:hypothetical protein n=1 Tax=Nocardia sp. NPDC050408 TaxID=3364319 RepID=UPI00379B0BB7
MKTALLSALSVPLLLIAPATALADPDAPQIFSQDKTCTATQGFVNQVRSRTPDATPDQIADAYIAIMDANGAYQGIEQYRDSDRATFLDNMRTCGL